MIGTIQIEVQAANPNKPSQPMFAFQGSPSSLKIMGVPRSVGNWAITRVYIDVLYPDNTTKEVDCVRTGNVWVGTFEGSTLAGRVTQGYQIKADGVDENENPITGYVLGCGDVYILDDTNDIKALVGKTAMRYLDDIPSTPAKGDVVIVNGALKIYDGEEWYTVEVDLSNYYTKSEIDETVAEIDSSISALGDEIPTKTSDLTNDSGYITSADIPPIPTKTSDLTNDSGFITSTSSTITELESSVSQLESSMTELESSMTELESTMSGLDGLAVKYDDANKTGVHLGNAGHPMVLTIPDNFAGNGMIQFRGVNHISRNSMTLGVADTGETVGNTHVQLGDSQAPQAQLDIGANVQVLSFNEEGKSQILVDGERLVVVTPNDVAEGKTLVASYVPDTPINGLSSTRKGETMAKRDNPEGHWEYVSADLPSKTSDLTNDSGFVTSDDVEEEVADKRDYDDLTYNDKTVRAPTYGIGKFTATMDDGQTDPIVMDTFGINDTYGSLWLKSSTLVVATQDGTNFTAYDISFNSLATFTRTQLLAGEVSFTYDNKEWTLTAELGDGMVDSFDITINTFTWHTSHYAYDPQTKTSKWWSQDDGFFLTRSWTSSSTLSNFWTASLYRGDDGVHGNVLVASFSIGGTVGYRAGGYVPSFTYGDITQSIAWQVAGYPCQGTFGFSECIPTRNSQLVNDSQFVRQADLEDYATTDYVDQNAKSAWRTWEYEPDGLKFTAEEANSTVAMQAINSAPTVSLEYSTDGTTWSDFIVGTTTVTLANVGDSVVIRAKTTNDKTGSSGSDYNTFVLTGKVAASGSILYLLDKDGGDPTSTLPERCFNNLFRQQSALTTAPKLPSLNLGPYSYSNLFFYCDSLTGCPVVQATSLDNLSLANMFNGCRSLNSIKIAYTGNFTNAFTGWVWDVSSTGTFYYNGSDTSRGGDAIPNNWNVQTF